MFDIFSTGPAKSSRIGGGVTRAKPSRRHHPDFDKLQMRGWKAAEKEAELPSAAWEKEKQWALRMGLTGSDCLEDKSIPTFARGELPHYAGINTFLKAPYIEDVTAVGAYDAAIMGIPFDGGTTYRPGTRFGPQALRKISALYTPYNYEMGVDLREQMTLCDVGDVFPPISRRPLTRSPGLSAMSPRRGRYRS